MSSFFTQPASQRKRKRAPASGSRGSDRPTKSSPTTKKQRLDRDESISGSDSDGAQDDFEDTSHTLTSEHSSSDEGEDAAGRRTKLAARYLENTRKEILAEGFDAKDIDNELLSQRMGDRLKQDTAESKGKLYRWIANDYLYGEGRSAKFSNGTGTVTGVAVCYPHIYTVSKEIRLSKWELVQSERAGSPVDQTPQPVKPKLVRSIRGDRSRKRDANYDQHTNEIFCVAASSDGKFVATGGQDRKLVVWDAVTLGPLRAFTQHRDAITSLSFRRGTNQLFTASRDRTVKIWSLDEMAYVETLYGHQDEILDVASLNQEHCVTAGARDRTARYWRVVEESQLIFRGGGAHNSLAKRAKGEEDTQQPVVHIKLFNEGSTDRIAMIDEETFVTGSDNGSIALWSIQKKKAIFTWPLAHGVEEPMNLEDFSAEIDPRSEDIPDPQPRGITALKSIPYSNLFFSGSWDGHIRVWKVTEDRRHLESLGSVNTVNGSGESSQLSTGVVNDIAIFEQGPKGKDGLGLVAVTGKGPRFGRWKRKEGRNTGIILLIPKKL